MRARAYASLDDYPDSDASRRSASNIRAQINGFIGYTGTEESKNWCAYFWRQGYKISVCRVAEPDDSDGIAENVAREIARVLADLPSELQASVHNTWLAADIDVAEHKRDEVLGGLLSRQVRLASEMATQPNLWSLDLGLIVLRCMVDTYITLAWLCRFGTAKHFEDFVDYGLGQEKLLVEHFKAQAVDGAEISDAGKGAKDWVEQQRMMHFIAVDVGDWINKTKRQMAAELGEKDIYSLAFSPFSGAVHGTWNSIARVNLQTCFNPLHKFHRVPSFEAPPLHLSSVVQAIDIMQRTLSVFCAAKSLAAPSVCADALVELKEVMVAPV